MTVDDRTYPTYEWETIPDLPDAACNQPGMNPDWWFPTQGEDVYRAKSVCATCPHTIECLQAAIDRGEKFGIWGGRSENERRDIRRQTNSGIPLAQAIKPISIPLEPQVRYWLANNPPATTRTIAVTLNRNRNSVDSLIRQLARRNVIHQTGWEHTGGAGAGSRAALWTITP